MSAGDKRLTRRISRRRFLASSATAAAAAAALSAVGCGEGERRTARPQTPAPTAVPARVAVGTRGGTLRVYNYDAMAPDTLDPHLTQLGPIVNLHSAIFSRVLRYEDERAGVLAPDLAASMPEQPDETTYIIRLRPDVRFHDDLRFSVGVPQITGRELTANDVASSILRQADRNVSFQRLFFRRDHWDAIDRVDVQDDHTLVIKTRTPVAPFARFLAGRHAFILPQEIVERGQPITDPGLLIGTGPFIFESFEPGTAVRVRRNPAWFARDDDVAVGEGRPFIDRYEAYFSPEEDLFQRTAFERRIVDATGFSNPATLDDARTTNLAGITLGESDAGSLLVARLLLDRAPFRDDRIRRAVHLALDRQALIDLLYPSVNGEPSALLAAAVTPGLGAAALGPDDLARRPGYRSGVERAGDLREARALWDAASGSASPPIRITFGGKPGFIPARAADAVARQLREALGAEVTTTSDPTGSSLIASGLVRNLEGASEGVVPFTFMLEERGGDPDEWLYPYFRSGQPMNTARVQDAQLDGLLDSLRSDFDADTRRQVALDAQEYLLANVNAHLEIAAPIERRLTWNYVRNGQLPLWSGGNRSLADVWIDTAHTAWRPRPT